MFKTIKNTNRLWLGLRTVTVDCKLAKFLFFYGDTIAQHQVYDLDHAVSILMHSKFCHTKKTLCYLHGYEESIASESVAAVISAYIERNDHNVLLIDWGPLAEGNYLFDALANLKHLAPRLADVLLELIMAGLVMQQMHVVGHSLGAHLAGLIGRYIVNKTQYSLKLPRISGLDPAFPGFFPPVYVSGLCESDAAQVDVIHTDAWMYGMPFRCGHIDFWPNGGTSLQPGCPRRSFELLSQNDLCSHKRSWMYWAESVRNRNSFLASRADSWTEFKRGVSGDTICMGIDCLAEAVNGNYYLQTNAKPLFSRGQHGIRYREQMLEYIDPEM